MEDTITIGQLAKQVELPTKTIRYYESIGLLEPASRGENRYRRYTERELLRLRLIRQARALDLPLEEVKRLVNEGFDGTCAHLRSCLLAQLPHYIQSVRDRMTQLEELSRNLSAMQARLESLVLAYPNNRAGETDCCEVIKQLGTSSDDQPKRGGE